MWDAPLYDEVSTVQRAWGQKVLAWRTWRGDESVLDAGCGTGSLTEDLLARVPRGKVVAVDNDPSMVARARERLAKHGPRVKVLHEDIQHLDHPEPSDVIFSNAVLHWVPDHDAVFATFLRHLKPGGELLVQCGGEGNLERIRGIASQVAHLPAFETRFRDWTPSWHYEDDASTQERLLIAGFVDPKVTLEAAPTPFADAQGFRRFAEGVVVRPYLQRLADPHVAVTFVDEFMRRVGDKKHDLVFDYVRLNIRARRSPHHS
jgi:trans-aconitate 2-methyltransferase